MELENKASKSAFVIIDTSRMRGTVVNNLAISSLKENYHYARNFNVWALTSEYFLLFVMAQLGSDET
jgi:hypothetical protein